jgi:hypothetical protein
VVGGGAGVGGMAVKNITDRQVCEAVAERLRREDAGGYAPASAVLMELTGEPLRVCERAIERAARRGLLDWGSHCDACWLTDAGWGTLP